MLSQKSRPYIEASVPVLREHGVTITRTFYSNMFAEFPEFTHLFNMGNQANGSQQQSLASAVFAYAVNFENADALAPVISRIAHKHASVGITAEHYPLSAGIFSGRSSRRSVMPRHRNSLMPGPKPTGFWRTR
jgi:nitric oxide dioxygenase